MPTLTITRYAGEPDACQHHQCGALALVTLTVTGTVFAEGPHVFCADHAGTVARIVSENM